MHVDVRDEAVDDGPVPVVHPGPAAADQPDAGIEPPERGGPAAGLRHVVRGGVPAVHLVAQAPVPDAERLCVPVRPPAAGPVTVTAAVAVLQPGQRLVQGADIHVEAEHRLDRGHRAPAQELTGAETAGLLGTRRGAQWPADISHPEVTDGQLHQHRRQR